MELTIFCDCTHCCYAFLCCCFAHSLKIESYTPGLNFESYASHLKTQISLSNLYFWTMVFHIPKVIATIDPWPVSKPLSDIAQQNLDLVTPRTVFYLVHNISVMWCLCSFILRIIEKQPGTNDKVAYKIQMSSRTQWNHCLLSSKEKIRLVMSLTVLLDDISEHSSSIL